MDNSADPGSMQPV